MAHTQVLGCTVSEWGTAKLRKTVVPKKGVQGPGGVLQQKSALAPLKLELWENAWVWF